MTTLMAMEPPPAADAPEGERVKSANADAPIRNPPTRRREKCGPVLRWDMVMLLM